MKPIETYYKGYRFRSRLEARWAVFFDALSVRWEYEIEGYKLKEDIFYLPDFYLPDFHIFAEIKPQYSDELDETVNLMRVFRDEVGAILLLVGIPGTLSFDGEIYCWDLTDSSGGDYEGYFNFAFEGHTNALYLISPPFPNVRERRFFYDVGMHIELIRVTSPVINKWNILMSDHLAYRAAKSARFEHGQHP